MRSPTASGLTPISDTKIECGGGKERLRPRVGVWLSFLQRRGHFGADMSKRTKRSVKRNARKIADWETLLIDAREAGFKEGLWVRWSKGRIKRYQYLHVMIEDEATGFRLLNWWPTNGTWTDQRGGKGKCDDVDTALYLAATRRWV